MPPKIIHGLEQLADKPAGAVVTIGNFDGVHRGHQRIVRTASELAADSGVGVVAVSFEPPPVRLIAPASAPEAVMHMSQRCEALGDAGADTVMLLNTTPELLSMTPGQFVRDVLVEKFAPSHVVEGGNFFFGHKRAGNVATLAEFGREYGFQVHVVEAVTAELFDGEATVVSSSLIRRLIRDGRVEDAAICLGRPYAMLGAVVPGRGLGRELGFPTANLDCGEQLVPADGVYAGRAALDGKVHPAAISVGTRPTFGDLPRAIEAFILDEVGDLYDRQVDLAFLAHVRPQEKFDSAEKLRRQMAEDIQHVRERYAQYDD